jgi:hypothetical protein
MQEAAKDLAEKIWLNRQKSLTPPQRTEPLIGCVNHDCAKCKPLTDDQLMEIYLKTNGIEFYKSFARAIEAAHGIKENT